MKIFPFFVSLSLALPLPAAEPAVLERGPHHRVVETASGGTYTALADGMHYQNGDQWLESKEEIELFQDGAMARQGQHKAVFSPNLKTPGAIELLTPDGKRFRSHVFGLVYYDAASGQSTLLAEAKDSIGQLVAPNRVVYVDAFDDIQADVQFTWIPPVGPPEHYCLQHLGEAHLGNRSVPTGFVDQLLLLRRRE